MSLLGGACGLAFFRRRLLLLGLTTAVAAEGAATGSSSSGGLLPLLVGSIMAVLCFIVAGWLMQWGSQDEG